MFEELLDKSQIESDAILRWKSNDTFSRSLLNKSSDYVFYDGPPFANGLPHHGHLLTGFIKDTVARYYSMLGSKVERKFGWDCHGLPAEMQACKELDLASTHDIAKFGIDKFNQKCRDVVNNVSSEWRHYVERSARWVDMDDDYKTIDLSFMESVMWVFKTLYDRGLIYESYRVSPYSWACETPVSDFETKMDNSYREKTSKSVTLLAKLAGALKGALNEYDEVYVALWTTTPWTLPSNLAIAVGKDIDYSVIEHDGKTIVIASALKEKNFPDAALKGVIKGSELVGMKYTPIFDYFSEHENAFQVLAGDFVTTEDGTGVVHMAPGFGEDDFYLCKEHNIKVVCPVDSKGVFTTEVTDLAGRHVFETNDDIIKKLKANGSWLKTEQYIHSYPHCWRTDTPLIYKAIPSWFLKVTAIKDKMIKNNQKINWVPSHIKDGLFGKWLENTRDWSISRNRYWGSPIPIWKSDDPKYPRIEVYGSIAELEEAFGVKVSDLHRPEIDALVRPNVDDPTGKSMMRRVPEILDCWFESGSMPYGACHYPFENKDWFEKNFPADFVTEYISQTRGWFYTLLVLSTALFDEPPFLNCICHGVILASDGQKLSKRLKNYTDPVDIFNMYGADALRWFFLASPVLKGQEVYLDTDDKGIKDALRHAITPLMNAYHFFAMYANADKVTDAIVVDHSDVLLDRYILVLTSRLVEDIKAAVLAYNLPKITVVFERFMDTLNNWYIRRSRERFWASEGSEEKQSAYNTLYTVLSVAILAIAPMLPLHCEILYSKLMRDDSISVHLEDYPDFKVPFDAKLVEEMERIRDACNAALSIRNKFNIRIRQPLASVTFVGVSSDDIPRELKEIILDEINVRTWLNVAKDELEKYADYSLKPDFKKLGKRMPQHIKEIIKLSKEGVWDLSGGKLYIGGYELHKDEYEMMLKLKDGYKNACSLSSGDALVLLDTNLTEELLREGYARDIVRAIQNKRKDMDLNMLDRIEVILHAESSAVSVLKSWEEYIKQQTLCDKITLQVQEADDFSVEVVKV